MTIGDMSLRQVHVTALEKLDNAVCTALTSIEPDDARRCLSEALADCAATGTSVPAQILACVEAAGEHLGYSERMEARTLLTVAHRMLIRVPRPVVLPGPSTPGDVILRG